MMASESRARIRLRLADAVLPVGSLLLLAAMLALILSAAGNTLGYDFEAYAGAARRLINGERLYDAGASAAGGFGIYLYPPPFAVAITPLLLLPDAVARWVWVLAMGCCLPLGANLMPVRRDVRWKIVCLGALSWPFLYSVKLGQVGPLLFLLFAAAWRWMDRPWAVGVATALGTLVKVQPALLGVWAVATGRWRAAVVAVGVGVAAAAAATLFTGPSAWATYADLVRGLGGSFSTGHNFAPGAVAHLAGASDAVAAAVQLASVGLAAAALLAAFRWASPTASLQVTIVASQLLSSPLRDHYAMLLLLPVAWLVSRGRTWAAVIPLLGWIALFADDTAATWPAVASIPLTFFGVLALLLWEAYRERREEKRGGGDTELET
jgi:Glycosyltransferase family 87